MRHQIRELIFQAQKFHSRVNMKNFKIHLKVQSNEVANNEIMLNKYFHPE